MVIYLLHLLLALSLLMVSCHSNNSIGTINLEKTTTNTALNNQDIELQHTDFLIKQIAIDRTTKKLKPSAKTLHIKQKYPFILVQDTDYGILTEPDLWFYNKYDAEIDNTDQARFIVKDREEFYHASGWHSYWQCFPTENIEFSLTECSVTSDIKEEKNYRHEENEARLELYVYVFVGESTSIQHYYKLPHISTISKMKTLLAQWEKILLHEDYFCLGGMRDKLSDDYGTSIFHGETNYHYNYHWELYDIKTKHSCYGYADNCKSRLKKYRNLHGKPLKVQK